MSNHPPPIYCLRPIFVIRNKYKLMFIFFFSSFNVQTFVSWNLMKSHEDKRDVFSR